VNTSVPTAVEAEIRQPERAGAPRDAPVAAQVGVSELVFNGRDEAQAGFQTHLLPLQCSPADPPSFRCNAVINRLCGNALADLRIDAARLSRRDADIVLGGGDRVIVIWQLAGRSRIRQGPNQSALESGNWTVCDGGRAFGIDFEQSARCLLILVPRSQCAGWLAAADMLAATALPASGPVQIARTILTSLMKVPTALDGRSERALHDSMVALIGHALDGEMERRGLSAQASRSVDFARVRAYVLDRIADQALTVERVAAAFGMSRRSLYKVFAPAGVTPHSFIQNAKLERASALLSDPGWRHAPIVRIAEQCGFADAAHFSRAFHAHHGAAPNAWRDSEAER
jgi:AraC-like DNA-binding protein